MQTKRKNIGHCSAAFVGRKSGGTSAHTRTFNLSRKRWGGHAGPSCICMHGNVFSQAKITLEHQKGLDRNTFEQLPQPHLQQHSFPRRLKGHNQGGRQQTTNRTRMALWHLLLSIRTLATKTRRRAPNTTIPTQETAMHTVLASLNYSKEKIWREIEFERSN